MNRNTGIALLFLFFVTCSALISPCMAKEYNITFNVESGNSTIEDIPEKPAEDKTEEKKDAGMGGGGGFYRYEQAADESNQTDNSSNISVVYAEPEIKEPAKTYEQPTQPDTQVPESQPRSNAKSLSSLSPLALKAVIGLLVVLASGVFVYVVRSFYTSMKDQKSGDE